jgi:hypothetical protein
VDREKEAEETVPLDLLHHYISICIQEMQDLSHQQAEARSLYRSFLSGSISSKRPNNDLASSLCLVPLNLSVEGKLDCNIK